MEKQLIEWTDRRQIEQIKLLFDRDLKLISIFLLFGLLNPSALLIKVDRKEK